MRIVDTGDSTARVIDEYASVRLSIAPLAQGDNVFVGVTRLAAGGSIGRHPTARRQLLSVIAGSAVVSGADGAEQSIGEGQGALWEPGESHEVHTIDGMTAISIEGDIQTMG